MAKLTVGQARTYRVQTDALEEFSFKGYRRGFYDLDQNSIVWFPHLDGSQAGDPKFKNRMIANGDIIEEISPTDDKFLANKNRRHCRRFAFPTDGKGHPYRFEGVYEVDKIDAVNRKITYRRISKTLDTSPWQSKAIC